MRILLIDNYDSFTYNLYHYLQSLKCNVKVIRNDKITAKEIIRKNYKKIIPYQLTLDVYKSGYRASLWSENYKCKKTYARKNK